MSSSTQDNVLRETLAGPSPAFAAHARRFHLYLWKWKRVRFLRLPSGAGLYSHVPTDTPLALELPSGERLRLSFPPSRDVMPYFVAWRGFAPVEYGELIGRLEKAERLTARFRALSVSDLRARFGGVPVAPEDAYASGQCWFGSKAWAEVWIGSPAPPVDVLLSRLYLLPSIEVPAFVAAAAYAVAYVAGTDADLLNRGATAADVACAVAQERKADGSGAYRLPRLNARPNAAQSRSGQVLSPAQNVSRETLPQPRKTNL